MLRRGFVRAGSHVRPESQDGAGVPVVGEIQWALYRGIRWHTGVARGAAQIRQSAYRVALKCGPEAATLCSRQRSGHGVVGALGSCCCVGSCGLFGGGVLSDQDADSDDNNYSLKFETVTVSMNFIMRRCYMRALKNLPHLRKVKIERTINNGVLSLLVESCRGMLETIE